MLIRLLTHSSEKQCARVLTQWNSTRSTSSNPHKLYLLLGCGSAADHSILRTLPDSGTSVAKFAFESGLLYFYLRHYPYRNDSSRARMANLPHATRQNMQATTNSTCHWLKLPAELRNQIYQLCVVYDDAIEVTAYAEEAKPSTNALRPSLKWTIHVPQEPSILATAKRIRQEALGYYYGANTFQVNVPFPIFDASTHCDWLVKGILASNHPGYHYIPLPDLLSSFATYLGPERCRLLRSVRLKIHRARTINGGDWIVSCRLIDQDVISVAINSFYKEGVFKQHIQRSQCSCDLTASTRARAFRVGTDQNLVEVLRAFAEWHTPEASQIACTSCGLKMVKRRKPYPRGSRGQRCHFLPAVGSS